LDEPDSSFKYETGDGRIRAVLDVYVSSADGSFSLLVEGSGTDPLMATCALRGVAVEGLISSGLSKDRAEETVDGILASCRP
jgi:hypothetical protein